jgi:hypothetical protein
MTFQSRKIFENTYEITTDFDGSPVIFNVVIATDESEIPGLVEHHLSYLANPATTYPKASVEQPVNLQQIVQQQAEQIQMLTERLSALEAQ